MTLATLIEIFNKLPDDIYLLLETNHGKIIPGGIKNAYREKPIPNLNKEWLFFKNNTKNIIYLTLTYPVGHNNILNQPDIQKLKELLKIENLNTANNYLFSATTEQRWVSFGKTKHLRKLKKVKEKLNYLVNKLNEMTSELKSDPFDEITDRSLLFQYTFLNTFSILRSTIYTSIFFGIGLNKTTIQIGNTRIMPGRALIISKYPEKNKSICDFSFSNGDLFPSPKKYTNLSLNLLNHENRK